MQKEAFLALKYIYPKFYLPFPIYIGTVDFQSLVNVNQHEF